MDKMEAEARLLRVEAIVRQALRDGGHAKALVDILRLLAKGGSESG